MKITISVRRGLIMVEDCPDDIIIELHDYDINEIELDNPNRSYGRDSLGDYEISELE